MGLTDKFEILTGSVWVSDPCYEAGGSGQVKLDNVRTGQWSMLLDKRDEGAWGSRVAELVVSHNGKCCFSWEHAGQIGVDSGQAGVFDVKHYRNDHISEGLPRFYEKEAICPDEDWYSLCCDRTLATKLGGGGVVPYGAVSRSGFGDGAYDVYVSKDRTTKEIVGIKIVFIEEEENGYCPFCSGDLDADGYCSGCDAYEDDEQCGRCGELLDYDGVCPNHCYDDEV